MTIHYRTQGFVFKKIDFGEADRFYWLYTKDFGKLEIFAKGIRKIKAKLKSPMELLNLSEIEFIQGRKHKTLTDALIIESWPGLKKDLEKLKIAFEITILFDKLLKGEEKDEKLWNLTLETFKELNNLKLKIENSLKIENCKLKIIYYYFLWNLVSLLGYRPEIQKCVNCQKKINFPKVSWTSQEGGPVCSGCFRKIKKKKPLFIETLKILKLIFQNDWQILKRLKITPQDLKNLEIISEDYLTFVESHL